MKSFQRPSNGSNLIFQSESLLKKRHPKELMSNAVKIKDCWISALKRYFKGDDSPLVRVTEFLRLQLKIPTIRGVDRFVTCRLSLKELDSMDKGERFFDSNISSGQNDLFSAGWTSHGRPHESWDL